jgi:uncharacterized protein (TIGR03067 family)
MLKLIGLSTALVVLAVEDVTKKKDEDLFQGTWVGVKLFEEGEKAPEEKAKQMSCNCEDDVLLLEIENKTERIVFKLDASKKPKQIGFQQGGRDSNSFTPGIYELDGDTLKICWKTSEQEGRPTDFKPDTKNKWSMVVLKRKGK